MQKHIPSPNTMAILSQYNTLMATAKNEKFDFGEDVTGKDNCSF